MSCSRSFSRQIVGLRCDNLPKTRIYILFVQSTISFGLQMSCINLRSYHQWTGFISICLKSQAIGYMSIILRVCSKLWPLASSKVFCTYIFHAIDRDNVCVLRSLESLQSIIMSCVMLRKVMNTNAPNKGEQKRFLSELLLL
jgi:hypothetical protein